MPCRMHWEDHGFVVELLGDVLREEVISANAAFLCDPRFDGAHYVIWDSTGVGHFGLSAPDIEEIGIASIGAATWNTYPLRVAHVIPEAGQRALMQAYIAGYQADFGSWVHRIFLNRDAARAWTAQAPVSAA